MRRVVVVGHGMVGSRFVDELVRACDDVVVTVLGAEHHEPYNRVLLSELVAGRVQVSALALPTAADPQVTVLMGTAAVALDRRSRTVTADDGRVLEYDALVLATGARPRVPDVPGLAPVPSGVHPLRTLDDAHAVVAAAAPGARAVVVGGGVLGLEVACGLTDRGADVTVLHGGPHLMDRQLDAAGAGAVEHALGRRGIRALTGRRLREVLVRDGRVQALDLGDGDVLAADLVVLAAGTVPQTSLALAAGLAVGHGIVVDGTGATVDPHVFAIGDCAQPPEGSTGLIAQGWDQARRLAQLLSRAVPGRTAADTRTATGVGAPTDVVRLKAHGLEVVTMGQRATSPHRSPHRALQLSDPCTGRHVELVVAGGLVVGAICVGAGAVATDLVSAYTRRTPVPTDPAQLLLRPVRGAVAEPEASVTLMPDRATVCRCNGVTKGDLTRAWADGARTVTDVATRTRATTGCGGCTDAVCGLLDWLAESSGDDPVPVDAEGRASVTA